MSEMKVRKLGITDIKVDAIVNAANEELQAGGGVCGAVFKAAGRKELQAACDAIGHCDTGKAVITPGFHSKAKYIIHAVGPRWQGGKRHEPKLLYSAYQNAMELAVAHGCRGIAFPLISSGIYGYPKELAMRKAVQAVRDFLKEHEDVAIEVIFVIPDEKLWNMCYDRLREVAPDYTVAAGDEWDKKPMPKEQETLTFKRAFTAEQMKVLRRGHVPEAMEDKWFWYMQGNKLYAHRSWTGICIYIVEFCPGNVLRVRVNRNPKQYYCTSDEEDLQTVNKLLSWWTEAEYDYYGEWMTELVEQIEKTKEAGKGQKKRVTE